MLDDPEIRCTRFRVEVEGLTLHLVPTERGFAAIEIGLSPEQGYQLGHELQKSALLALAAGDLALGELQALVDPDA